MVCKKISMRFLVLMLFAVVVGASNDLLLPDDCGEPSKPPNSQSPNEVRAARDVKDDPLTSSIQKMQEISRITTAISLQLDLNSGTLNSDDFISELLSFGSVAPNDITSLDVGNIEKAVAEINGFPMKYMANEKATEMEEKLLLMDKVRNMVRAGGGEVNWVGKTEFLEDAQVASKPANLTIIQQMGTEVRNCIVEMEKLIIKQFDSVISPGAVKSMKQNLDSITSNVLDLVEAIGESSIFTEPDRFRDRFDSFTTLREFIERFTQTLTSPVAAEQDAFNSTTTSVKMTSTLSEVLRDNRKSLEAIRNIINARRSQDPIEDLKYPGFPRRYLDLKMVSRDLRDPWIKKSISADILEDSLKPLSSLSFYFEKLHRSLGQGPKSFDSDENEFWEELEEIEKTPADSGRIDEAFEAIKTCKDLSKILQLPSTSEVLKFELSTSDLYYNVKKWTDFLDLLTSNKTQEQVSEVMKLSTTSDDPVKMKEIVDTLKSSTALIAMNDTLTMAKDKLALPSVLAASALKVINEAPAVDKYFQDLKASHSAFFNCLLNLPDDQNDAMVRGIKMSRHFHGTKRKLRVTTTGVKAIRSITKSVNDLKQLKVEIQKIQNGVSVNSEPLKRLLGHQQHAMVLGSATRRVTVMKKLLNEKKRSEEEPIIKYSNVVEQQMTVLGLWDPEDVKNLKVLVDMKVSLEAMYKGLETWSNGVKESGSMNLRDYQALFSLASKVPGVSVNLTVILVSLDKLITIKSSDPTVKSQLVAIKLSLDKLNSMDLDFAKHQTYLAQAPDSLDSLDVFFADLNANDVDVEYSYEIGTPFLVIGISGWVTALVFGALLVFCYWLEEQKHIKELATFMTPGDPKDRGFVFESGRKVDEPFGTTQKPQLDRYHVPAEEYMLKECLEQETIPETVPVSHSTTQSTISTKKSEQ